MFAARAIEWWTRAGERAAARADYAETLTSIQRALALLPGLPDTEERREAELRLLMISGAVLAGARGFPLEETRRTGTRTGTAGAKPQNPCQRRPELPAWQWPSAYWAEGHQFSANPCVATATALRATHGERTVQRLPPADSPNRAS